MKMAKASERDIDAAGKALGVLDSISRGYYPGVEDDAPLEAWLKMRRRLPAVEDCEEASAVYRAMLAAAPAAQGGSKTWSTDGGSNEST